MRRGVIAVCVILVLSGCIWARKRQLAPAPNEFIVGRHTSFDFGPPNDYYELFIVTGTANGTSVERMTLTPAADVCTLPAKAEVASATLSEPVSELLGGVNPCAIPKKDLHRELKRCKKCMVFSFAEVAMQVQCGGETRVIRSEILDRDMFDPKRAATPKNTSWTMQLLSRLGGAVGPSAMDKPMFGVWDESQPSTRHRSAEFQDVGTGKYDMLFSKAPDKLSDLYAAAQKPMPVPTVRLVSSEPFAPEATILPPYPGIARLAHVEGTITLSFFIGTDGRPVNIIFDGGPRLLQGATAKAVSGWKFHNAGSNERVHASMQFKLNCPIQKN